MKGLYAGILLLGGILALMPLSWKRCISIALVIVVLEGAIRKWLFPGFDEGIYFAKDVVLGIAYLKYYTQLPSKRIGIVSDSLLKSLILCNGIFLALEICNPDLGSVLVGLVGLKNYLFYVPLVYLVPQMFDSQEELVIFLRRYLLLIIPEAALAILQHSAPPDSWINVYARPKDAMMAFVGESVRATGTFSYIAGFGSYLQIMGGLLLSLLVLEQPKRWNILLGIMVISLLGGVLFSGSRTPLISLVLFVVLYYLLNKVTRYLKLHRKFIAPMVIGGFALMYWAGSAVNDFSDRVSGNSDLGARIGWAALNPFRLTEQSGITGFGVGAAYQAVGVIRKIFNLAPGTPITVYVEAETEKVMIELGPIGFVLWYLLRFRLLVLLWRTFRRSESPLARELGLSAFLIHLLSLPGQMVFQVTFNLYYWFLAGFAFLLPRLDEIGIEAEEELEALYEEEEMAQRIDDGEYDDEDEDRYR